MTSPQKTLADSAARLDAIAVHDRCFLVEAGAGSGKTAIMAGRIALLLAQGIAPRSIAALTFTEFAASELFIRVRAIVDDLAAGDIPTELRVALPDGLSEDQRCRLATAREAIDELTCSTIHGFCQRLITPYPVEADIDPGAVVMDRDQADLAFDEIVDDWLRNALDGEADGLLVELVLHDPNATVRLIRTILGHLRRHRSFAHTEREDLRFSQPPSGRRWMASLRLLAMPKRRNPRARSLRPGFRNWPKRSGRRCRPVHHPSSSGSWLRRHIPISTPNPGASGNIGRRRSGEKPPKTWALPRLTPTA